MQILKLLTISSYLHRINIAAGIKSNQQMIKSTWEERPSLHGNTTAQHFMSGRDLQILASINTRVPGPIPGEDEGRAALWVLRQGFSTAPLDHLT